MALTLHWKFDEVSGTTAADSSGNSRSGTLSGTTFASSAVTGPGGTLNGALILDGTNDYVSRSSTAFHGYTAFTFAIWCKKTTSGFTSNEPIAFSLGYFPNAGTIFFEPHEVWPGGGSGGGTAVRFDNAWYSYSDPSFDPSQWHHWAITYDGTNLRVYRDGVLKYTSGSIPGKSLSVSGWDLIVGNMFGYNRYYPGSVDDFRVYDNALTLSEVQALYDLASGGGAVTGSLAATESGSDTMSASGSVAVSGSLAGTEAGSDTFAASGSVLVSGTMAGTESGSDTMAASGSVLVSGALTATETGSDAFAATGTVGSAGVAGSLAATESGADTFASSGSVLVSGSLNATESGSDTFSASGTVASPGVISGVLAATESGSDTMAASGTVLVSGSLAAIETGSDTFAAYEVSPTATYQRLTICKVSRLRACKISRLRIAK